MSRCLRMLDGVDSSSLLYKLALDPLLIEPGAENKWSTLCGTFNKERARGGQRLQSATVHGN